MYKTKIDIPENNRTKLIELLNNRLAEAIDLMLTSKQAHWNVKGPNFIALHELFDKIVGEAEEYGDLIAERAIQLGGYAEGTSQIVAKRTGLKEYPLSIGDGMSHVDYLSTALAHFGKQVRLAIDLSNELKDAGTADIFTEISRSVDKYLWFVEAHLQAPK
jgi:starvation-inducible DNA-binding protein